MWAEGYQKQFDDDQVNLISQRYRIEPIVFGSIGSPSPFEKALTQKFKRCLEMKFIPFLSAYLSHENFTKFCRLMVKFRPRWSITMRATTFAQSWDSNHAYFEKRVLDLQRLIKSCGNFSFEDNQIMIFLQYVFCHFLETFVTIKNMHGRTQGTDLMNHYNRRIFEMQLGGWGNSFYEEKLFKSVFDRRESQINIYGFQQQQQTLIRDRLLVGNNNAIENGVDERAQIRNQISLVQPKFQDLSADLLLDLVQFGVRAVDHAGQNQYWYQRWEGDQFDERGVCLFQKDNRKRYIVAYVPSEVEQLEQDNEMVQQLLAEVHDQANRQSGRRRVEDIVFQNYDEWSGQDLIEEQIAQLFEKDNRIRKIIV